MAHGPSFGAWRRLVQREVLHFDSITRLVPVLCQQLGHQPAVAFLRAGLRAKKGDSSFERGRSHKLQDFSVLHQFKKERSYCCQSRVSL